MPPSPLPPSVAALGADITLNHLHMNSIGLPFAGRTNHKPFYQRQLSCCGQVLSVVHAFLRGPGDQLVHQGCAPTRGSGTCPSIGRQLHYSNDTVTFADRLQSATWRPAERGELRQRQPTFDLPLGHVLTPSGRPAPKKAAFAWEASLDDLDLDLGSITGSPTPLSNPLPSSLPLSHLSASPMPIASTGFASFGGADTLSSDGPTQGRVACAAPGRNINRTQADRYGTHMHGVRDGERSTTTTIVTRHQPLHRSHNQSQLQHARPSVIDSYPFTKNRELSFRNATFGRHETLLREDDGESFNEGTGGLPSNRARDSDNSPYCSDSDNPGAYPASHGFPPGGTTSVKGSSESRHESGPRTAARPPQPHDHPNKQHQRSVPSVRVNRDTTSNASPPPPQKWPVATLPLRRVAGRGDQSQTQHIRSPIEIPVTPQWRVQTTQGPRPPQRLLTPTQHQYSRGAASSQPHRQPLTVITAAHPSVPKPVEPVGANAQSRQQRLPISGLFSRPVPPQTFPPTSSTPLSARAGMLEARLRLEGPRPGGEPARKHREAVFVDPVFSPATPSPSSDNNNSRRVLPRTGFGRKDPSTPTNRPSSASTSRPHAKTSIMSPLGQWSSTMFRQPDVRDLAQFQSHMYSAGYLPEDMVPPSSHD